MQHMPEHPPIVPAPPKAGLFTLSPLNQRRWNNFCKNRRALWSLWIFAVIFGLSLFAEFLANEKPIVVNYRGGYYMPIFNFYAETEFGGDFRTEAQYRDAEVHCLIVTGGLETCFDDPEGLIEAAQHGSIEDEGFHKGWMIWPPIRYSFKTPVERPGAAPLPPNGENLLGTDDAKRDVLARVIYGFRLSIVFTLIVTFCASIIGIIAGALQGFFGGWLDLICQRVIEIWGAIPSLYVIIIMFAIFGRSYMLLLMLTILFSWTALVGVVRAEFLRARNLEYVRAARALGVSNWTIMFRHMLPNAMVATLTFLPFLITGTISTLAGLDFLGFGLPPTAPSLGELTLQAKQNLQAPWLAFTAFCVFAIMLSLLVFIFEQSAIAYGHILGNVELRGKTMPIIDFRGMIGNEEPFKFSQATIQTRKLVVLKLETGLVGLLVYSIDSIITFYERDILPFANVALPRHDVVAGCLVNDAEEIVILLDHERLLDDQMLIDAARTCQEIYPSKPEEETKVTDERKSSTRSKFILFRVGRHRFAFDISLVSEIIDRPDKLLKPPYALKFVDGILNLRGQLITLINPRILYNMPAAEIHEPKVLIFQSGEKKYGMVVDSVYEIVGVQSTELLPVPSILKQGESRAVSEDIAGCLPMVPNATDTEPSLVLDIQSLLNRCVDAEGMTPD